MLYVWHVSQNTSGYTYIFNNSNSKQNAYVSYNKHSKQTLYWLGVLFISDVTCFRLYPRARTYYFGKLYENGEHCKSSTSGLLAPGPRPHLPTSLSTPDVLAHKSTEPMELLQHSNDTKHHGIYVPNLAKYHENVASVTWQWNIVWFCHFTRQKCGVSRFINEMHDHRYASNVWLSY